MSSLRGDSPARTRAARRCPALSPREREILGLIGEGLTNRQIGKRLYLSEKTVKNNVSRLLAKLGVERRIQAAVIATQAQDRATRRRPLTPLPPLPPPLPRKRGGPRPCRPGPR